MRTKYWVWNTFYPHREKNADGAMRPLGEFKTRDGLALTELEQQFPADYHYLDTFENVPAEEPAEEFGYDPDKFAWTRDVALIVQTIRPPILDAFLREDVNKAIPRSYNWLECTLVKKLKVTFFNRCSRDSITLAPALQGQIPAEHMRRTFRQNAVSGSWYSGARGQPRRTCGYVAFLPRTAEFPAVLNVFGMGGNDTLRTAHLLRTRFPNTIGSVLESTTRRLVIVEMTPPEDVADPEALDSGLLKQRYLNWTFDVVADTGQP